MIKSQLFRHRTVSRKMYKHCTTQIIKVPVRGFIESFRIKLHLFKKLNLPISTAIVLSRKHQEL